MKRQVSLREEKSDERSFDRGSESSFPRAERSVGSECARCEVTEGLAKTRIRQFGTPANPKTFHRNWPGI